MTARDDDRTGSINRRNLLKAAGATALGTAVYSGTVSAHPPAEIRFCGCSQVCVDNHRDGNDEIYRIYYATEEDDGYSCRLSPPIESRETEARCFSAGDGEKVIGVLDGARRMYANPNTCARKALQAVEEMGLENCDGCDDGCGTIVWPEKVGRHEYEATKDGYTITIRTRKCKPPAKWDDDPNGPPGRDGNPGRGNSGGRRKR